MEIKFFDDELEKFISGLERPAIAKVLRTIDLLESFGQQLGMPHSKKIGGRLFELRIRGKQEVRLIYTFQNNQAVLLHGLVKKTQKIAKKELKAAYCKLDVLDNI
jgi:hypothetical protein